MKGGCTNQLYMKKYKLHQWLPLLLALVIFAGCSKKNYPAKDATNNESHYEDAKLVKDEYTPPPVINISDEAAKSNKDGEMYYDNEYGYRYWRFCDGKYYLDTKYESGASPNKKIAKKKTKKQRRQTKEDDYATE